ncbi:MAG: glycosyltransferase family 4 protein, partial [Verrucomicrobia bacterium]|nr:glycosyltransferase family 4 protein [Verrucomicrobiota bacterium]
MKILLSAVACDPYRGSEAHFGWMALKALAARHDIWVLGHAKDGESMERARTEGLIGSNVHFYPHSSWGWRHNNRLVARIQNWRDYQIWTQQVLETARRLEREVGFDVLHHSTLSTWRVPSELWRLGKKFVWGPIGGAEVFPLRLLGGAGVAPAGFELLRRLQDFLAFRSPGLEKAVRNSAWIFASTPETLALVRHVAGSAEKSSLLSAAFFSDSQIRALSRPEGLFPFMRDGTLRLFAGGELEVRKGLHLALHALAEIQKRGIDFRYHVAGHGPELERLKSLSSRLGIAAKVEFSRPLSGDGYRKKLWETDAYLLPSLRDSAGLTLMEAMLAGCVPVVADCGGPGLIVDQSCGAKVAVGCEGKMVDALVQALLNLVLDKNRAAAMGTLAFARIAKRFTESTFLLQVESA